MNTIKLGLEWFLNPDHIPFYVAEKRGYYEQRGIELEVWEPKEHYDTLKLLEKGELDYAITEPIHLVPERSKGIKVKGIAKFLHTRGGIQYPKDSEWNTPRDLEPGIRLNYPGAPGPGGRKMVAYMNRQDGGTLDKDDIEPVDRGFYHTDALIEGDADIAFLAFYNFEIIESKHRGFETDLWELHNYNVPDFNQLILTASDEKIKNQPSQIKAFCQATKKGINDTVEEPETAKEIFYDYHPEIRKEDPELMDKITNSTIEFFTPNMSQDIEMYQKLINFCDELDLSENKTSIEKITDNQFM